MTSRQSQGEALGPIRSLAGRGVPLRGDDIDTDRIMPARFLRAVSFDGLEQHLFEDDKAADPHHAFNNPRYRGASVLVVNSNFGCGSSREHAPQGLARFGIHTMIGESFSDIFQGNSAMLGIPCFTADRGAIDQLQKLIESSPETNIEADVDSAVITAGPLRVTATLPSSLRDAFLSGQWNPSAMLLDRFDEVRRVGERLPYISGF